MQKCISRYGAINHSAVGSEPHQCMLHGCFRILAQTLTLRLSPMRSFLAPVERTVILRLIEIEWVSSLPVVFVDRKNQLRTRLKLPLTIVSC